MFTNATMWLKDTGILDKLKHDIMNPPIPIPDPTVRHKQPLILRQLGIIMIILIVGLATATLAFFIELCKRPKSRNVSKTVRQSSHQNNMTSIWVQHPFTGLTPVIIE